MRTRRLWFVGVIVWGMLLLPAPSGPGGGLQAAIVAASAGDLESISPDEAAPEDRDARADEAGPEAPPARRPAGRDAAVERRALASLAEQLRQLWGTIPTFSPVDGASWLTSGFGWRRDPLGGKREFHGGIDLAARRGTPIVAPAAGVVERAFRDRAAGLVVVLEHGNGIETIYGHLDRILVRKGEEVARGDPIGVLGNTGSRTTGPHLHYAIKVHGKYVNPRRYLFEAENPVARAAQR